MAERELAGKDLLLYRGSAANGVKSATVTAGGTGYTSAPTVGFSGGGGTGAAGTAVLSGAAVVSITITNAGTGYTSAPTIALTGGAGSGATATSTIGELFDLVACLTSTSISQSSNVISADTKCGIKKLSGTKEATISFDLVALIDPSGRKVSLAGLQADYDAGSDGERNWKMTTAGQASGDPIYSFAAYLSEYNISADAGSHVTANGSLQVSDEGVTLTAVA